MQVHDDVLGTIETHDRQQMDRFAVELIFSYTGNLKRARDELSQYGKVVYWTKNGKKWMSIQLDRKYQFIYDGYITAEIREFLNDVEAVLYEHIGKNYGDFSIRDQLDYTPPEQVSWKDMVLGNIPLIIGIMLVLIVFSWILTLIF